MTASAFPRRYLAIVMLGAWLLPLPLFAQSRGELLYVTHCSACHTAQMHWRANRDATDFPGLVAQVRRWQGVASLGWIDPDINDVARYLNETIYHFDNASGQVSAVQWSSVPSSP